MGNEVADAKARNVTVNVTELTSVIFTVLMQNSSFESGIGGLNNNTKKKNYWVGHIQLSTKANNPGYVQKSTLRCDVICSESKDGLHHEAIYSSLCTDSFIFNIKKL